MNDILLEQLSKEEKRLLLYLETRCVDYGGVFDAGRMNSDDYKIAKKWNDCGFLQFGRISSASIRLIPANGMYWCRLSEHAWKLAHQERMARFYRSDEKRAWMTTEEFRATQTLEA